LGIDLEHELAFRRPSRLPCRRLVIFTGDVGAESVFVRGWHLTARRTDASDRRSPTRFDATSTVLHARFLYFTPPMAATGQHERSRRMIHVRFFIYSLITQGPPGTAASSAAKSR